MSVAFMATGAFGAEKASLRTSLGRAPWAVADQMVISATNFVTIILLARGFSQASLGSFTLVYSGLLFVNSLQGGLITQPHNILGATRQGEDYASYTSSTALSQLLLAVFGAGASLMGWVIAGLIGWEGTPLLLGLAPAIIAWQLQEFGRRVLYTEGRLRGAFVNDLLSYGGQTLAIATLYRMDCLTGPLALQAIAATSAMGALVGVWQIRDALVWRIDKGVFRENWHFGKWVAGGEIFGHWMSAQLFVYLAAGILGAAAAGVLRAVHTVFGPSRVLADVFCTMLPIRFARTLADGGKTALHIQLRLAYLLAIPLLGGYCLLVAVCAKPILSALYGNKYAGSSSVLALYAVSAFASYMTMIVAAALRAKRLTRPVFLSQTYASVIALPLGWLMILMFGIQGTVLGMIATYLAMGILLWRMYDRDRMLDCDEPTAERVEEAPHDAEEMAEEGRQIAGPGLMLTRIFELLDEAKIPYCVLHGYEAYPHSVRSDVDCLMPKSLLPGRLAKLLHGNRARTGAEIVQWIHAETHYVVLAGKNPDGSICFLRLDVANDCEMAGRVFYKGQEVLRTRQRHGTFWAPSPEIEFGWYLARRIIKGTLNKRHERLLNGLYEKAPAECRRQVERLWEGSGADLILAAATSENWGEVRRNLGHLRRELLSRRGIREAIGVLGRSAAKLARRIARWAWPRHGLSVVVLGPDGAGKSSVVQRVREDLAPAFFSTVGRSFPPALLHRGGGVDAAPHAAAPRSWSSSVMRAILYWYGYSVLGYCFTTRKDLARCALVMHDRHLVDSLVDPRRYRYSGPIGLLRAIWRATPKPDLVIVLDAPAEVIQERKREVAFEETARQREAYWRLARRMPNGRTVNAAMPLTQVVAEVDRTIVEYLATRAARQLGLPAEGCIQPTVNQVLRQLPGWEDGAGWTLEKLGQGDQAEVFLARARDGQSLWQGHDELVVKLYRVKKAGIPKTAYNEVRLLGELSKILHGQRLHGWTVYCPVPLYLCERPFALVMTKVPGLPMLRCLESEVPQDALHSAGEAAIVAMERYWAAGGEIYGDLDPKNILCDFSTQSLSFVDPG
ncbi:MAG TPA: hypothetical protein VHP11_02285, partial [Tepidisphaeraceae bacterium]|nr:hypothetical protein [Tepidisphaeraceae bacterium]